MLSPFDATSRSLSWSPSRAPTVLVGLLLALVATSNPLNAQTTRNSTVGFEVDAFPYITGGYYGSVWLGVDHVRFRGVGPLGDSPPLRPTSGQHSPMATGESAIVGDRI